MAEEGKRRALVRLRHGDVYLTEQSYEDLLSWIFDGNDRAVYITAYGPMHVTLDLKRTWALRRSEIVAIRAEDEE